MQILIKDFKSRGECVDLYYTIAVDAGGDFRNWVWVKIRVAG